MVFSIIIAVLLVAALVVFCNEQKTENPHGCYRTVNN